MTLVPAQASYPSCYSNTCNYEYDAFVSFRGEDTRDGFVGTLRSILIDKGINTFIDDEDLRKGDELSPALVKAIEKSRIYIVVFSENYASSTWCLDELVKILDCMQLRGQLVLPVFYKIAPSEVRKQTGSFEEAMANHERRFGDNSDRVKKWRSSLMLEANHSGWHYVSGYEIKLIQEIVEEVSGRLNRPFLHVATNPVGIDSRTLQVISQLGLMCNDDIRMVGIYGIGGIGKSTIARAVYNIISRQFDCASFLSEVRETSSQRGGLVYLQETLLADTLCGKKMELVNVYRGINVIRQRLSSKKILLILDDVNDLQQLQALAGMHDWFGPGSRIIITTMDKHLLAAHNVSSVYQVELLTEAEALELLSWHAFRKGEPDATYLDISKRVVDYCECLPLAIEVIGRAFVGRSVEEWEDALCRYKNVPQGKIQDKLKMSYDDLEEIGKQTFLHIACSFKGEKLKYVHDIYVGRRGDILHDYLRMHNLIQGMGKEIVRKESKSNAGKRSRVWFHEDAIHVLTENMGTDEVEGIMLDPPPSSNRMKLEWCGEAFKKMKNLKILIIKHVRLSAARTYLPNCLRFLHREYYRCSSFPSGFYPRKLAVLEVPYSHLTLQKSFKFLSLTRMDFSFCDSITKVPDLSGVPNLVELLLFSCQNLVEIHNSVGSLDKLVGLNARKCIQLTGLPQGFRMKSLECLLLHGCSKLRRLPDIMDTMEKLWLLDLYGTDIEELPSSIQNLPSLHSLQLMCCRRLQHLPRTIASMQSLQQLHFEETMIGNVLSSWNDSNEDCTTVPSRLHDFIVFNNIRDLTLDKCNLLDQHLPLIPRFFPCLNVLSLRGNHFERIPGCFRELQCLETLDLSKCAKLKEFPDIIPCMPKLERVFAKDCLALSPQSARFILDMAKRFPKYSSGMLFVSLPGTRVPDWVVHRSKGTHISFYARGEFPKIILCIAFQIDSVCCQEWRLVVQLFINRKPLKNLFYYNKMEANDLVWLFSTANYGPHAMEDLVRDSWDEANWNHVEIRLWIRNDFFEGAKAIVKECGIHLYEEENNMEDVCFSCPPDCQEAQQFFSDEEENHVIFGDHARKQMEERADVEKREMKKRKIEEES